MSSTQSANAEMLSAISELAKMYEDYLNELEREGDVGSVELNDRITETVKLIRKHYSEAEVEITVPILWTMLMVTSIDKEIFDGTISANPVMRGAVAISEFSVPPVILYATSRLAYDLVMNVEL